MTTIYIDNEMEWDEWITKLWVANRLQEEDMYEKYLLAGGEKEKWKWVYHIEYASPANLSPESIGNIITSQFGIDPNVTKAGIGGLEDVLKLKGIEKVYMSEDGTFTDANGNKIEIPEGYSFVKL